MSVISKDPQSGMITISFMDEEIFIMRGSVLASRLIFRKMITQQVMEGKAPHADFVKGTEAIYDSILDQLIPMKKEYLKALNLPFPRGVGIA
jgi:hypothetical protein